MIAKTDPPLRSIAVMFACRGSVVLVNWLQDRYREVAVALAGAPELRDRLGRNAASMLEHRFARLAALDAWRGLPRSLAPTAALG